MQNAHVSQCIKEKHATVCIKIVFKTIKTVFSFSVLIYISLVFIVLCAFLDVVSMATALDDFIAPDCRFINIKKGQMIYVYSKLVPEEGAGVFWSGSVCAYLLHGTKGTAVTNKCELSGLCEQNVKKDI